MNKLPLILGRLRRHFRTLGRRNVCDLYCIGAQKAGTSWAHFVVSQHPRTYTFPNLNPITSENKEAHFWDWSRHRGVNWYRDLLAPPSRDRIVLDFTPNYALLDKSAVKECRALSPDAKIVYILRDPVARAVSALRMRYLWTNEIKHIEFDDLFMVFYKEERVKEHGEYVKHYQRWESVFGTERILVINFDDMLREPAEAIERVLGHVGLKSTGGEVDREEFERRLATKVWVSETYPLDEKAQAFLETELQPLTDEAERVFGIKFEPRDRRG
jgi:hypothetical protein